MFPLSMEELEIHGDRPPVGTLVRLPHHDPRDRAAPHSRRGRDRPAGRDGLDADSTTGKTGGSTGRAATATSFRQPRDYLVGEELPLDDPAHGPVRRRQSGLARTAGRHGPARLARRAGTHSARARGAGRVPGDGGFRAAARATTLGSDRGQGGRPPALARASAGRPTYPADLAIVADAHGRPRLTQRGTARRCSLPAISIAHADGVAVALAALDPAARVGIDVEPIVDRPAELRSLGIHAGRAIAAGSLAGSSRAEWVARFWCAKEAAAKAAGLGIGRLVRPAPKSSSSTRIRVSSMSGSPPSSRRRRPDGVCDDPLRVVSARRADRAWAWTLGEGAES